MTGKWEPRSAYKIFKICQLVELWKFTVRDCSSFDLAWGKRIYIIRCSGTNTAHCRCLLSPFRTSVWKQLELMYIDDRILLAYSFLIYVRASLLLVNYGTPGEEMSERLPRQRQNGQLDHRIFPYLRWLKALPCFGTTFFLLTFVPCAFIVSFVF